MTRNRKTALILLAAAVLLSIAAIALQPSRKTDGGRDVEIREDCLSINAFLSNDMSSIEDAEELDSYIEKFMKRWEIKGSSLAVIKDGHLIYSKGYGWADEENGVRMSPGNIFRIASLSKLITATAVMQLCERKVLSLDDKVFGPDGILDCPQFRTFGDRRMKDITVDQLLRHQAGFTMHRGDPLFTTREIIIWEKLDTVPDMDRVIEYVLGERLGYTPGTGFCYSNVGYLILTKVIEVCSGMDYEEYCQENILRPAGCFDMHMAHNLYEERYSNEVRYYETHDATPVPAFDNSGDTLWRRYGGSNIEGLLGAGGWVASPSEFARFVASIDGDPVIPDVLSASSVRKMTENQVRPIGWVRAGNGRDWLRTGTLAGTSAVAKKEANGCIWMFVTNTSSWKGSRFTRYIDRMYRTASAKVHTWPKQDLFSIM
ncbi:MAG TPA: beta-lactamase family protein [Candidatus Coprenecus pullistercoris]|nr:beta-lactamase family protein [Candidatus Coprenecus pullistercoris]